jgi:hypothetical protein
MRVMAPNELMDRDTSNDEACGTVDVFAAIAELLPGTAISIHPNPCRDRIQVSTSVPMTFADRYRIVDATGRESLRGRIGDGFIDVAPLEPGCYLLLIEGSSAGVRFVKQAD